MKKILFLFSALILTVSSCRKDIELEIPIFIPIGEDVTTNLHGRVVDASGRSIAEAAVIVEDQTTSTNGDGYFYMPNISVPSDGFVINVRGLNNDKILRRVIPQSGTNTYEEVVLTSLPQFSTFSAVDESIVTNGSTSVTIPPNSLVDKDGNTYEGDYLTRLIHYNPSNRNLLREMPGNLQGIDKDGKKVTLGTYGMIDIEVTDSNGEPLRLAPSKKATVKMFISEQFSENLPATIPTWKLDEKSGLWLEEDEVIDRTFIEDVGFFFFDIDEFRIWNCDVKELNTNLTGRIIDQFGVPIENRLIQFTFTSGNQEFFCSGGNTNSKGEFNTRVPRDLSLTLSVYDHNCMDIIYTQKLEPLSGENNEIDDVIAEINKETYTITGVVIDCSGDIAYNNATIFLYDQSGNVRVSTQTNEDGSFAIHNTCFPTSLVEAYTIGILDLDSGNYISNQFPFSEVDTNLGNIFPCDDLTGYVNVISGFGDLSFDDPSAFLGPDSLTINAGSDNFSFSLFANVNEEGVNPVEFLQVKYNADQILTCTSIYQHTECSEAVTLTISVLNDVDRIITGKIEGILYFGEIVEPNSTQASDVSIEFSVNY